MVNDSGNAPEVFLVDSNGDVISTRTITNAKNIDWEELACDEYANIYIGDIGDNLQKRESYRILKLSQQTISSSTDSVIADIHNFKYSTNRSYDAEAFIYFKQNIYIFTKNREEPFDGITNLFKLSPNDSIAYFQSKIKTCTANRELCWVTSASLSPDKSKLALLGSDRLFLFTNFKGDDFFGGDMKIISISTVTQKESLDFISNTELIISDEYNRGFGGKIYYVDLNEI